MKQLAGIAFALLLVAGRQESASAVYSDGLKAEGEKKLDRAIKLYERAVASDDKVYGARAQFQIGVCYEKMSPPNVASAQSAYDAVKSKYSDQAEVAAKAEEKLRLKGVDVYLGVLAAGIDKWRDETPDDRAALEALRKAAWDGIQPLGPAGAPGLIWGFTHPEPLVRDFCAENLRTIVDEAGLAEATKKLGDPEPLANATAAASLRRVATIYGMAKAIDDRAKEMEAKLTKSLGEIEDIPPVKDIDQAKIDGFNRKRDELKAQVAKEVGVLRDKAKEIRKNIPSTFDMKGPFTSTLKTILANTGSLVEARIEAARMLDSIDELKDDVVNALLAALEEPSSELRADAARTLGSIPAGQTADRQRAAVKLQEMVQYEPEKETDKIDWRNTGLVRVNAAYALGGLGVITAVPSLIEALDDNDSAVRDSANKALIRLCGGDRAASSKDKVPGFSPNAPKEKRAEAIGRWKAWWDSTGGVEVLVDRYRDYAGDNASYDTSAFFDPYFLERRLKARELLLKNNEIWNDASKAMAVFNAGKKVIQDDVVALGNTAVKELLKYVGGEFEGDPAPPPNASVRMFVAECLGKIAENSPDAIKEVREVLLATSSPSKAKQIGAAYALGQYSGAGAQEFDALTKLGLTNSDYGVKEAAARALGMRPQASHVGDLAAALRALHDARDSKAENAMVAICSALGRIKARNPDAIQALGTVARGPSTVDLARESAALALGEIGATEAVGDLVFARTDMFLNVRLSAREAFLRMAGDAGVAQALAAKMQYSALASDKVVSSMERRGAALALGDVAGSSPEAKKYIQALVVALRGKEKREEQRKYPRDPDPGVRSAACEALGNVMTKARPSESAMHVLAEMLNDPADDVRHAAHVALTAVLGKEVEKTVTIAEGQPDYKGPFKPGLPEPARLVFVEAYDEAITKDKGRMDPE